MDPLEEKFRLGNTANDDQVSELPFVQQNNFQYVAKSETDYLYSDRRQCD